MRKLFALILLALTLLPAASRAETETVYTLIDESGKIIASICHECEKGDEYFSGDNQHYRVIEVDGEKKEARVEALGAFELPDVSWLDADAALPVSSPNRTRKLALYCTHSDESYKPGDGVSSSEKRGGIYDVANALADSLREKDITVEVSDNTHLPHDAGAYRRHG